MLSRSKSKQQGVALITAILAISICAIMVTEMSKRQQIEIRRTANLLNREQALFYARGAESWAIGLLKKEAKKNNSDALGDDWALGLPPIPIDGGQLTGRIYDQQGLFNLNNLVTNAAVNEAEVARFKRLFKLLGIEVEVVDYIVDWLDEDVEVSLPYGAEDSSYALLQPGYRVANAPLFQLSELRLVKGMDQENYEKLLPYITVLPSVTRLNVNTAPALILQSLADNLSEQAVNQLVRLRGLKGFDGIQEFLSHEALAGSGLESSAFSLESHYFWLQTTVLLGDMQFHLGSLLFRQGGVSLIYRTQQAYHS